MSTNGENITTAVSVLKETYKNLSFLFSEMDRIAIETNFTVLTPKFLRLKSDSNYDGGLTTNFIKLYRDNNSELQIVYGIEVDLEEIDDQFQFPTISVTKFNFVESLWSDRLSINDHWVFYDPFREQEYFDITEEEGIFRSLTQPKSLKRYMDLQSAVARSIPLVSIQSPEDIRNVVFPTMRNLV